MNNLKAVDKQQYKPSSKPVGLSYFLEWQQQHHNFMIKSIIFISLLLIAELYQFCFSNPCATNMKYDLDFYTQYNQFYICDGNSSSDIEAKYFWTKEAYKDRLAIQDDILGVGTGSYGHIKGELYILDHDNNLSIADYNKYEHIVEGGLNVSQVH